MRQWRRHRRRRRALRIGLLIIVAGVMLAGAWLAVTGLRVRSDLDAARGDLAQAKAAIANGDRTSAQNDITAAGARTTKARNRTNDVVWRAAAAIPFLGDVPRTVRGLATAADTLARDTLQTAVQAAPALNPATARPQPDRINLTVFENARVPLGQAADSARRVQRKVDGLPSVGYASPIADARHEFQDQIHDLVSLLSKAQSAAEIVPPMLGAGGPRRYLLIFQTNAEARGTGGLPGGYAIIRADRGRVRVERVGSDGDLDIPPPGVSVDLGAEYEEVYGELDTTRVWPNTNVSPHFPDVSKIWMAVWHRLHPTQRLDGAMATDPVALSYVLGAIGPVLLSTGEKTDASSIVKLLEVDTYARFKDDVRRKAFQVSVARTVLDALLSRGANASELLSALGRAADEGRALAASAIPAEQSRLVRTAVGGAVELASGPSAYLVINNAAGNKLDYYLQRTLTYTAGGCGGKTRESTVRITLTNTAPRTGLPAIVTGRLDLPAGARFQPGTSHSIVYLYATRDAALVRGTVDGEPLLFMQEDSYAHQLYSTELDLAPGQTKSIVIRLVEPVVPGPAYAPVQPLVTPMAIETHVPVCKG